MGGGPPLKALISLIRKWKPLKKGSNLARIESCLSSRLFLVFLGEGQQHHRAGNWSCFCMSKRPLVVLSIMNY